jgi:hypothetical protein
MQPFECFEKDYDNGNMTACEAAYSFYIMTGSIGFNKPCSADGVPVDFFGRKREMLLLKENYMAEKHPCGKVNYLLKKHEELEEMVSMQLSGIYYKIEKLLKQYEPGTCARWYHFCELALKTKRNNIS